MATITEDYVSFETAKLLKEKGFDEPCNAYWFHMIDAEPIFNDNMPRQVYNNKSDTIEIICCPTLQMAMKWLRKEHNLCIVSLPVVTDDEGEGGCLWKYTISMKLKVLFDSRNLYESPEIALDDAIKRCSENLI